METDTTRWLNVQTPKDVNEKLIELRAELINLNRLYQQAKDEGLTKGWAAIQLFTPEKLEIIEQLNRRICIFLRKEFQNCWNGAMDLALQHAQTRLQQVFPDRDSSQNSMIVYKYHRNDLYEKLHGFVNPHFTSKIFQRWRVFDVMLDERENRWCFVITDPYTFISKIIEEYTDRKPYELTRSLEFAFRKLLGDYNDPKEQALFFNKNCVWEEDHGGCGRGIKRYDIFNSFKSCTEI